MDQDFQVLKPVAKAVVHHGYARYLEGVRPGLRVAAALRTIPKPKTESSEFLKRRARRFLAEAEVLHAEGKTARAIPLYHRSIEITPTAEAHAYLGWAYSKQGRPDLAIQECLKAIHIDSEFGNSYNDIGSYLVSQGKIADAFYWFERAKKAKRYESPHFPYLNLGRLYEKQGNLIRALGEYRKAMVLCKQESDSYDLCMKAIERLQVQVFIKE